MLAMSSVSREMTRVDTTPVTSWVEKSVILVGLEQAALGTASRGMTHSMVTFIATSGGTRDVCETGKGQLVRAASKTGSVLAALPTVCPRIAKSRDITNAGQQMARKNAFRGGLVPIVACTAFLTTMMITAITPVRMTEVRRAMTAGMARTAPCTVFLKTTTCEAITPVTKTATKSA